MSKRKKQINNIVIQVNNLSKCFKIPKEKTSQLKHYFLNPFHKPEYVKFDALKDVSFEVKKGEFLGIIGRNGSGKSTLLKILAGVYQPSEGKIKINGKVTPFLELGVGFNPELSARENIFLNGTILGMTRKYLLKKFDEIVDFAEIREFIDMPVKNFSSGMQVRLAFAIMIQSDAETYLVDEVLAVGDANFQEKCFDVFRDFKRTGKTVVFVSHDLGSVELFCDRAMLVDGGEKIIDDIPKKTIFRYLNREANAEDQSLQTKRKKFMIREITITDSRNHKTKIFKTGDTIKFIITLNLSELRDNLFVGLAIHDKNTDAWICGNNSYWDKHSHKWKRGKNIIELSLPDNQLNKGTFYFYCSVFEDVPEKNKIFDLYSSKDNNQYFRVFPNSHKNGLVRLKHKWNNS